MKRTDKTILVMGATGRQGGIVARCLLARGWSVRAFTRDPHTSAAQMLQLAGAEVVQGDANDQPSLEEAMQGVYGVFNVQPPIDYPDDLRQGKNVADVARKACVEHFVYTSVSGAQGQATYRKLAKWEIEQHVWALGLKASILRPAWFMDGIISSRFGVPRGMFSTPIKPEVAIHMTAAEDMGPFVALMFDRPDMFLGTTLEIAGDALTPLQLAVKISHASGRALPYVQIPMEDIRQISVEAACVYDFVNEGGLKVDLSVLRQLHPDLMDFDTWLEKKGKARLEALGLRSSDPTLGV